MMFSALFSSEESIVFIGIDLHNQFMDYPICYLAKFDYFGTLFQCKSTRMCSSGQSIYNCYFMYIFLLYSSCIYADLLFENNCEY